MIKKNNALLGVCPIGKFVFSHEDAIVQKNKIFKKLNEWGISYCDTDNVLTDGIVRDQEDVEKVVNYFKSKCIDALFIPHCNFGTEGAVGMIAKLLNVPVLLWGPRDEAPNEDGSRLRDSLCGMFASSKVLHKLKVPFTYVENCRVEDDKFKDGLLKFIGAASVAKAARNMKIGQIGGRIDFFWSTIVNESELLDKFGVKVLPIDIYYFINNIKERAKKDKDKYVEELAVIRQWLQVEDLKDQDDIFRGLALRDEMLQLAKDENLDAFSVQSFNSIPEALGSGIGLGTAYVIEQIPIADESDIHGAISSVMINAAKRTDTPCFFPEYTIRHPENDNAVLLWHGVAPLSLRNPEPGKIRILPPWILKGLPPVSMQYRLMDGDLTVCRFDGDDGEYMLGIGEAKTVPGPRTREFYTWMEVNDWPKWEKAIMEGPYIHHCSCVFDKCADVLEEACKYIPGLKAQRYDKL